MSTEVEKTLVLEFGSEAGDEGLVADWDASRNVDAAGQPLETIGPGATRYFMAQHDETIEITRVAATIGEVIGESAGTIEAEDLLGFGGPDDAQSLTWWPADELGVTWYGNRGAGPNLDGRQLRFDGGHPCLALFSYLVHVKRWRLEIPKNVHVTAAEPVPFRIYIYYQEVSP